MKEHQGQVAELSALVALELEKLLKCKFNLIAD